MAEMTSPDQCQSGMGRGSGLYVDMENLHSEAQPLVKNLIDNWPDKAPELSRLTLYVRADQTELWSLWAKSRFSHLDVVVKGTQHFSMASTKNSADIAIATNAIADLILRRISHVVVFSDDSDFISLYVAIRDEPKVSLVHGQVPFLWVVTDREGSLSPTIRRFFPTDALHVVAGDRSDSQEVVDTTASSTIWAEMAEAVLREIPIGPFKSTECQPVIKKFWPRHAISAAGGAVFGTEFKNNLWPILEEAGVKIRNPGKKPIQYEMTSGAKRSAVTYETPPGVLSCLNASV